MAEGRQRANWRRTATLLALIHNANYREKVSVDDCDPYARPAVEDLPEVGIDALRALLPR